MTERLSENPPGDGLHTGDPHRFVWTIPIEGGDWVGVCSLCSQVTTAEHDAALTAKRDALRGQVLPPKVERGAECFHGTRRACLAIRCGSNCSSRFDRMHPCPACLTAENVELREQVARVEALYGGEPPPVWIADTKVVRVTRRDRRLGCDITESMVRVDDVRAALHPAPAKAGGEG
jgi:hypothetical protein